MGWDEAGWHPVSFQKAPKPFPCLLTVAKSSHHLLADLKLSRFFFSSVKSLLTLLLFCTNSNVNMQGTAIMKELHFTLSV
jgi:hypothetical protein